MNVDQYPCGRNNILCLFVKRDSWFVLQQGNPVMTLTTPSKKHNTDGSFCSLPYYLYIFKRFAAFRSRVESWYNIRCLILEKGRNRLVLVNTRTSFWRMLLLWIMIQNTDEKRDCLITYQRYSTSFLAEALHPTGWDLLSNITNLQCTLHNEKNQCKDVHRT